MAFSSTGGKNHFKRHSLANIADAWKNQTLLGRRGSTAPSFLRTSSATALDNPSKNGFLESIQIAVIQLFQKKKLQEYELSVLQENVRNLVKTEAGPLIIDYYKDKLIKKGMVILREGMKNDLGMVLLKKMCDQWQYFYTSILPILQAMLYELPTKDFSIRKVTMLEYRDTVVLKVGMDETLNSVEKEDVPPAIVQMLLVLQSVHDGNPPTENYAKLEKLVARVISPHLGFFGLYEGSPEPVLTVDIKPTVKTLPSEKSEAYELDTKLVRPRSSHAIFPTRSRHGNGLPFNHLLAPLVEQETGRRHSIQT